MNPIVEEKLRVYPTSALNKFHEIRSLIFDLAEQHKLGEVEETLKWGQPSYLCNKGSTLRLDWQKKNPDKLSVFFNCKTNLVETFKEIFSDNIEFDGKRIIQLSLDKPTPTEIETCLLMALKYHTLKKLPLLGA